MDAAYVKQLARELGADLCGIAPADRLEGAPEGFRPRDVLPSCRSVIAFALRFPVSTLACDSLVPYTVVRNTLSAEVDRLSVLFCSRLEAEGAQAVPTGAISPTLRDPRTGRSRNVVSAKHCAEAAGLGRIGRNTLLVTPEFGNMVWLGAVLCDAALDADEPLAGSPCPPDCGACVSVCPAHALDGELMNQDACFAHAFRTEPYEEFVFKCNLCRSVCPLRFGRLNTPAR